MLFLRYRRGLRLWQPIRATRFLNWVFIFGGSSLFKKCQICGTGLWEKVLLHTRLRFNWPFFSRGAMAEALDRMEVKLFLLVVVVVEGKRSVWDVGGNCDSKVAGQEWYQMLWGNWARLERSWLSNGSSSKAKIKILAEYVQTRCAALHYGLTCTCCSKRSGGRRPWPYCIVFRDFAV